MKTFTAASNYTAKENSILGTIDLSEYSEGLLIKNGWINIGGWQSWNPGFEIKPEKKQPSLKCHLIHQWNSYLVFPESKFKPSKNIVLAQFISYIRWNNKYLFLVSCGNLFAEAQVCPPVQFILDRKQNTVTVEIADKGYSWKKDEIQAKIQIFMADSYFEAKKELEKLFGSSNPSSENYSSRFDSIQFLGKTSLGWESWYNHYANINESLILEDLSALKNCPNFLSITKESSSPVFQIDDGWENQLGNWTINKEKFPNNLHSITQAIEEEHYIPGLWLAPFIIDSRTEIAAKHPEWLLKDTKGKLIPAGYNPLWGQKGTFYALDLSNQEVLNHLDQIMETVINEWGFRYIKLDFLYAGMFYGNFNTKTGAFVNYSKAIKLLTKRKTNSKGLPIAYLGCGAPLEMSYNDLPLCRIGCDTLEHWENKVLKAINWNGRNSAYLNLKDTLGHAITDKIVFANDPDVLFIRNENCSLSREEKKLIAVINIIFGSQIMYSDDAAKTTSKEEIELAEEIHLFRKKLEDEEFSIKNIDEDEYLIESKSKKYRGLINLNKPHFIEIEKL